jgi:hypothetical protein
MSPVLHVHPQMAYDVLTATHRVAGFAATLQGKMLQALIVFPK